MGFKKFEDIEAWKMARTLCKAIKEKAEQGTFSKDWDLTRQLLRSAGSVMDNIAEGHERNHNNEFIYFLAIAKGSAGEVRSQLYRAMDFGYLSESEFNVLHSQSLHLSRSIAGLIRYLKSSEMKGTRKSSSHTAFKNIPSNAHLFPSNPPLSPNPPEP